MSHESTAPQTLEGRTTIAGRYEILGLLGTGGMGCVYRAKDIRLDEIVALKLLARELAQLPGMLDRFRQEVKLARKVTHKNVARTFDLGEEAGEQFLTMELVEGESLSAILAREKRLSVSQTIDVAAAVCEGLAAAHAAGVVHRDLKPDNVLVAKDGRVVLTDFGIARALEQVGIHTMGSPIGTPAYMAPEQLEASPNIDGRADQYAFGVMLFEMLTGALPFTGPSPYAIAAARLMQPPPDPRSVRPDLPDVIANVIMRCMARKPEDRFAKIEEIAFRLGSATLPAISMAPQKDMLPMARPMLTAVATGEVAPSLVAEMEGRSRAATTPRGVGLFAQICAELHAFAHDYERSLELMRRASAANAFDIVWLERCPLFGPVRLLPGYEEVRAEIESRAAKIRDELV